MARNAANQQDQPEQVNGLARAPKARPAVATKLSRVPQLRFRSGQDGLRAVIEVVKYQGCTITVRGEVAADGTIRGSYEVVATAHGTTWTFGGSSDDLPETSDPGYLLEVARCEIDFALEVSF